MIELIFLLIIIPLRVRALAKERNESALKWSLAAIGAWIGAEFAVGIILVVLWIILVRTGVAPRGTTLNILYIVNYLLVIGAAALGATLVVRQLRKKPISGTAPAETTQT